MSRKIRRCQEACSRALSASEELLQHGSQDRRLDVVRLTGKEAILRVGKGIGERLRSVVHCSFTLLVMGLCTAFRLWQAQTASSQTSQTAVQAGLPSALLAGEGTARWRKRLQEENRDTIIVFLSQSYGIFHLAELAILTHLPLRRLPSALGSPQAVLHRFGLSP